MDDRTEEQTAADDALNSAIEAWAHAYDVDSDGDIVTNWILVVESDNLDYSQAKRYSTGFKDNNVSLANAFGLLEIGKRHMIQQMKEDFGD